MFVFTKITDFCLFESTIIRIGKFFKGLEEESEILMSLKSLFFHSSSNRQEIKIGHL